MDAKNLLMKIPLTFLDNGAIRIGKTRVGLEIVIQAYKQGETADSILQNWDVLKPLEVYLVIAYYLANKEEVEHYLLETQRIADEWKRKTDESMTEEQRGLMERLRAIRIKQERDRVQVAA